MGELARPAATREHAPRRIDDTGHRLSSYPQLEAGKPPCGNAWPRHRVVPGPVALTDSILRRGLQAAKPVLDRFGIVAGPLRNLLCARRLLTVDRSGEDVRRFLRDPGNATRLFGPTASLDERPRPGGPAIRWQLDGRGEATGVARPGPYGSTEILVDVRMWRATSAGRPSYADNASVIALRAVHRAKSLLETGEVPVLVGNPTTRERPDPYGD